MFDRETDRLEGGDGERDTLAPCTHNSRQAIVKINQICWSDEDGKRQWSTEDSSFKTCATPGIIS